MRIFNALLQDLKASSSSGNADPYVKMHLLPGASKVCIANEC